MAIKIFEGMKDAVETAINEFEQHHDVFATQTHVVKNYQGGAVKEVIYIAVVFYKPKQTAKRETELNNYKDCPKCHKLILKSWNFHQECGWNAGRGVSP